MEEYFGYGVAIALVLILQYAGERMRQRMANTWTPAGEGELESVEETREWSIDYASAAQYIGYAALIPAKVTKTRLVFKDGSSTEAVGSFPALQVGTKIRVSHNELYHYHIETLS